MSFLLTNYRSSLLVMVAITLLLNRSNVTAASPPRSAAAADTFIEWTFNETPMGLYLPAKRDAPLPVVMFLHACHNYPVSRYLWIIDALNAIEPCAVFLPTAPEAMNAQFSCADWGGTYDAALRQPMIDALHELDSLIAFYGFDKSRQYLYGESMGGEGVYRLLAEFPARFAGAIDAAGYTLNKGAANMAQTPLWIFIGSEDELSPVDSSRAIHQAIINAGGTMVTYTEYPGLSHVGGIEKAREEPGALKWLLANKRSTMTVHQPAAGNKPAGTNYQVWSDHGTLHVTPPLPRGTIVSLFGLNGQLLFRSDVSEKSFNLPSRTADGAVFWRMSNRQHEASGRLFVVHQ
jgi:predicted peptidase